MDVLLKKDIKTVCARGTIEDIKKFDTSVLEKYHSHFCSYAIYNDNVWILEYMDGRGFVMYPDFYVSLAASFGRLNTLKYLIQQGGDPDMDGGEPLCHAAGGGHLDVVKYLIEELHVDVHKDAIIISVSCNKFHIVKYLIETSIHVDMDTFTLGFHQLGFDFFTNTTWSMIHYLIQKTCGVLFIIKYMQKGMRIGKKKPKLKFIFGGYKHLTIQIIYAGNVLCKKITKDLK